MQFNTGFFYVARSPKLHHICPGQFPYPVILASVLPLSINWQVNNQISNPRGLLLLRFSLWTCRNIYMVSACPLLGFTQKSSPKRSLLTKRIFMGYVAIGKLPQSCQSKKST